MITDADRFVLDITIVPRRPPPLRAAAIMIARLAESELRKYVIKFANQLFRIYIVTPLLI